MRSRLHYRLGALRVAYDSGGGGDPGPIDATCSANFTVVPGDGPMAVTATFGAEACAVTAGVPQP